MRQNMTRRDVLRSMTAPAAAVLAARCTSPPPSTIPHNILLVMTDDQAAGQTGDAGYPYLKTPNLDRIAAAGTRFTSAFCTTSDDIHGRSALLTGRYPFPNNSPDTADPLNGTGRATSGIPGFPRLLQLAGYDTAVIGDYRLSGTPEGFTHWCILRDSSAAINPVLIENGVPISESGHVVDVITYKALEFLRNRDSARPFCLICMYPAPHPPSQPAPRHANLWNDIEFPCPPTFDDDYASRPVAAAAINMRIEQRLGTQYPDIPRNMSREAERFHLFQRLIKDACRSITGVDENLGRLLNGLEADGTLSSTVIMHTGDNGYFFGEHGWCGNQFMYEPSLRIPLVIRHPKISTSSNMRNELVLNVDIAPTILDIAGVPVPESWHGESLLPLLRGENPAWRDTVYYVSPGDMQSPMERQAGTMPSGGGDETLGVRPLRGVRTDRWKLIEYAGNGTSWEFFDLRDDPHELLNRYEDTAYSTMVSDLTARLAILGDRFGGYAGG